MKKEIFLLMAICIYGISHGQHILRAAIRDGKTKAPLPGASVQFQFGNAGTRSGTKGFVEINNIPDGQYVFVFTHAGYESKRDSFDFPLPVNDTLQIFLEPVNNELEEVIVQSTRTSRTIANTATRVETVDREEIEEKSNMRPANVSMLLHESTGLQVQQTSATSGNASIRSQGLDGRYTQLLKDGYPNFGNLASGLSLLEIPPLDLQQVEVIKGPASTLYGGGAIAGVINFISKTPKEKADFDLIVNHSNVGQTNMGVYTAQRKGKFGYSILGLVNFQKAYDVDRDGFSELPKSNNFTLNPRLFYYPDNRTVLMVGNSFTNGNNKGGDMLVIDGKADTEHVYFKENKTTRNTSTFEFERKYANRNSLKIKQSLSFFDRKITIPLYSFAGLGTNSYTDLSYLFHQKTHTLIAGVNVVFDKFKETQSLSLLNTRSLSSGIYLQDSWDINEKIKIESGVRLDNVNYNNINYKENQTFLLPRIAALFKLSGKLSFRLGGGLGYKIPSMFTEQTEAMQYQRVQPLNNVRAEQSVGITADVHYRSWIGDNFSFSVNQLFFYTRINKPLVLQEDPAGDYFFNNAIHAAHSKGFETNIKLIYHRELKLFLGYTFVYAKAGYLQGRQFLPLVPGIN